MNSLGTENMDTPGPAYGTWVGAPQPFANIEDLAQRVPQLSPRDLSQLARIGALNKLTDVQHRRDALWQAEQAGRPAGPLLTGLEPLPLNANISNPARGSELESSTLLAQPNQPDNRQQGHLPTANLISRTSTSRPSKPPSLTQHPGIPQPSPLRQMNTEERLVADYAGTGLSIDHHPMAFRRADLLNSGVHSAK